MKLVAAYLLAVLGGNATPGAADVKKIIASVGGEVDEERLSKLLSELEGKNLEEIFEAGKEKFASMPVGGAVAAGGAAGAGGAAAAEAKEEEPEEEEEEEDMGFDLFD